MALASSSRLTLAVRRISFTLVIFAPLLLSLCRLLSCGAMLVKLGREKIQTRLLPVLREICRCHSCCQADFRRRLYPCATVYFRDFALQRSACGCDVQSNLLMAAISCCCSDSCCLSWSFLAFSSLIACKESNGNLE